MFQKTMREGGREGESGGGTGRAREEDEWQVDRHEQVG